MSSHREAPEISKDPVADNTDMYAFVSPDKPDTVTIITNYIPLEDPPGGPNFFEFGDDVLYSIYVDNDGDGLPDIEYQFKFKTKLRSEKTFLYNTGPITGLEQPELEPAPVLRREPGRLPKKSHHNGTSRSPRCSAATCACPPCNIGPRSTPNYQATLGEPGGALARRRRSTCSPASATRGSSSTWGRSSTSATCARLQNLHLIATDPAMGVDATATLNVHTIAIRDADQEPDPRRLGPDRPERARKAVLGIWGAASRRKTRLLDPAQGRALRVRARGSRSRGSATRCSTRSSCRWARRTSGTRVHPAEDKKFAKYVERPELQKLLPVLYPGVFPNLAALKAKRADLVAILLTGIPSGIVPGFQNYTGTVQADMLRLNVAIPPTTSNPNPLGLVAGDAAGFPNGRRVFDDVVNIELNAVAGLTYPLVDPSYTPDARARGC